MGEIQDQMKIWDHDTAFGLHLHLGRSRLNEVQRINRTSMREEGGTENWERRGNKQWAIEECEDYQDTWREIEQNKELHPVQQGRFGAISH